MKLQEHIQTLSREELEKELIDMAEYAGLDTEAHVLDGCSGHGGECGKCVNGVFIPCSPN